MKRVARTSLVTIALVTAILLILEAIFRLGGHPRGDFAALFPDSQDLYPRNQVLTMSWGPIPYVVETNNHGLRGEDFSSEKDPATLRILTIGDSITDGFFVDNRATWQYVLRGEMESRLGTRVEVVNGARGGGSIDRELVLLKRYAPTVKPDLVVLTVVSNDFAEIRGVSLERLLQYNPQPGDLSIGRSFLKFLMTRTGLGEYLFQSYLNVRSSAYRKRPKGGAIRLDDSRYAIAGGEDYPANVEAFRERFADTDGIVLGEEFSEETETAFVNYCALLDEFVVACKAAGAELVVLYHPAYPQIYDPTPACYINDRLGSVCAESGIDFLDMTAGFRAVGMDCPLHLAPLDFHPNPAGNAVFAQLVADHLTGEGPEDSGRSVR